MKTLFITAILLVLSAIAFTSTQAQIVNGSFETPDTVTYETVNAGETTLAPWVVGLTSVDLVDGATVGPAFDGTQYIDLDGTPGPGQLTQSFRTRVGSTYQLTLAYANNYINQPSASATVRVFDIGGDLLNRTITHSTSVSGDLHWTVFRGQFIARQARTVLEITSLSGFGYGGIFIDGVSVRQRR